MTDLFAVIGKPIIHSRSPKMHNVAFVALGLDASYVRLATETAKDALEIACAMGIRGLNVTSPFKEEMAKLVESADQNALLLGAVNTVLVNENGIVKGYNTDPDGVALSLSAAGVKIKNKNALVLGAGGAAKAATLALRQGGAKVTIANRTISKAIEIAKRFDCDSCALEDSEKLENTMRKTDLLVSTLSTSERVIDPNLLQKNLIILDANYSTETALAKDGKTKGCQIIDGREWLLHQGVKAFELFSGKKAPLEAMRNAVYANLPNISAKYTNTALIGLMGSGKNTVAKSLATLSGKHILDIDAEIEKKAGIRIADMFANPDLGEKEFRKLETEQISKLNSNVQASASKTQIRETPNPQLQTPNHKPKTHNLIVACGGGAILGTKNRETLTHNSTVIWLWVSPKTIVKRIAGDNTRPLLQVPDDEKEAIIARLLRSRNKLYAETADLVINTETMTPNQIAKRIIYEIDKSGKN